MKKSHIYTRTGDGGTTSLVGGTRVPKTHLRLEAYGTIDELNAHLGLLLTTLTDETDPTLLQQVQHDLFTVGAALATETTGASPHPAPTLPEVCIRELEQAIDTIDALLPPWRGFVLPGGCPAAAQCHVCRTVCRRAERCILRLAEEGITLDTILLQYINRLSDYLFVLARKINLAQGGHEKIWQKRCALEK